MADPLVVFITGAGRGIGFALTQAYLLQPNCTVIASTRKESAELKALSTENGSKLLLLEAAGIRYIDVVIANSGVSPPVDPLDTVDLEEMSTTFKINALGPLALFQATKDLLQKSSNPRWVSVSSAAGSISAMEAFGAYIAPAYSVSKAALNWITLSAHCGNQWLTAFAVNPGLVATDMGNKTAKFLGLEKAPYTQEYCAEHIINLIEKASLESTSGKFIDAIKGEEVPW
ncbi:Norsolorinic acid ketoreductase [Lachnellula hyalina]|uniref:Norsolorinic acid ketoreductase n=1 Tax=Lachnellula hyalina TaxID=1316788 RepID=A0A8H8QYY7_9HELO|nr:Norsolorinic acid ketoreductase [Lachnellula hyalina]TVY25353.1 Norsolorinic acid ketoreductase [Lachnellula hyalina]